MKQRHTKRTRFEESLANMICAEIMPSETRFRAVRTWAEPTYGKRGYKYNQFEFAVFVLKPVDGLPHQGLWDYLGRVMCDTWENAVLEGKRFIENKGI